MDGIFLATESWQSGTLTADSVVQCRSGTVYVHTGASAPGVLDAGTVLSAGYSIAIGSGLTVQYRAATPEGGKINVTAVR